MAPQTPCLGTLFGAKNAHARMHACQCQSLIIMRRKRTGTRDIRRERKRKRRKKSKKRKKRSRKRNRTGRQKRRRETVKKRKRKGMRSSVRSDQKTSPIDRVSDLVFRILSLGGQFSFSSNLWSLVAE